MKSNELRIGNWINIYDDFNAEITGFTNKGKVWFVKNPEYDECAFNIKSIKPIPLTEEWLLKFGFVRDYELEKLEKGKLIQYSYGNQSTSEFVRVCYHKKGKYTTSYRFMPLTKPKHVHQLQNLYFALTGKELNEKTYKTTKA